ncbi:MAG: insulinase family protein [Deltaproteobacteria bacterium]|nr:MAG: insulinase family protein [Deltaproteobacteria bacterium]
MPSKLWRLSTLAALLVAAAAHADKQAPPPPAPPRPFALPQHQDVALDNGARITTVPYGAVPKATIELFIRGGASEDSAQQVWLSELMGTSLGEGTRSRPAAQLAQAAAAMGGDLDVTVEPDQITIAIEVLSEFAPRAIALVADVVRNPTFPPADVARVKSDLVRRLAIARTQPQQLAREQFAGALYPDHPFGRVLPTEAMLQGYTVDQVRDCYAARIGAARSHLYVAGRFDDAAVVKAARDALADWQRGPEPQPVKPAPAAQPAVRVVDRPGAVQSTLIIGLTVPTPKSDDYVPLLVTDALLGGSFGSRITSNIREQKGYTYSPFSAVRALEANASWSEQADVTTNVTGASLTEIVKEISRLRAEAPSADELRGIQSYLAGVFVLRNSTRQGIIRQLAFLETHQLTDDYLRNFAQRVWAIKPADVQRVATTYLDPKKMTIAVVGDRKQIDAQLTPWTEDGEPGTAKPGTAKPGTAKPGTAKPKTAPAPKTR